MKKTDILLFLLFTGLIAKAQEAVHNYGAIQIHDTAMVGFHTNVINDGSFDQNRGLVGFYSDIDPLTVSGAFAPEFFDAEVAVEGGLVLETSIGVTNNGNLIAGDVITPRNQTDIYANFIENSFYTGENRVSKINGYAAITNKTSFVFPVGDEERLRPLTIESTAINPIVKCAYFFENPNNPKTLNAIFSTIKKASEYISVSDKEFWRLEGDLPSQVTLTWDVYSNIPALGVYISDLKVVGWSKEEKHWVNLGNTAVKGGMDYGAVTSDFFIHSDYEIITLGGNDDQLETFNTIELDNYYMTPNGDGQNDVLKIEGIEKSPHNSLQIFNRYGVMVYSRNNYVNEFDGRSNRDTAIKANAGLESGIYFYIITMHDLGQKHQGYLYIAN